MKKYCGFTMLELLVVLVIIAILSTTAVPSMMLMIRDNRLSTQMNMITGLLNYARKEAVSRNASVSICASNNATSCNSNNWEDGVLVFLGDAQLLPTPPEAALLKAISTFSNLTSIRRRSNSTAVPAGFNTRYIRYDRTGVIFSSDSGSFTTCHQDHPLERARALNINGIGQVRVATDTNSNDIVEVILDGALVDMTCA